LSRLLVDENFPKRAWEALAASGHDVAAVGRDAPGLDDVNILVWAKREQRVLVTYDTDFGDLIFQRGVPPPPAVLLVRPQPAEPEEALSLVLRALSEQIDGAFVVVTAQGLRRRPF
jgi:predicted nuclease of predicted toxin-antitoxin system